MNEEKYDLIVIGAGSGGVRAARVAAAQGHKVAIIEERHLGGTCVNVGCVPKKLFSYAAHFSEDVEVAQSYGWQLSAKTFDWTLLIENKNKEIQRLNDIYRQLLTNSGVKLFWGRGRLLNATTVEVSAAEQSAQLTSQRILIATGGVPFVPDFPGVEHTMTSDDVFVMPELGRRVAVIGGGYIAVEFASIFNALASETHLIYRGPQILKEFDQDLASAAQTEYQSKGIQLHLNTQIKQIKKQADGLHLSLNNDETIVVDQVLMATGRKPNVANLGLENTDIVLQNGFVPINAGFETQEKTIYALGDVRIGPALTPVALEEAMVFVDQQFNQSDLVMDYNNIATAVFSMPNLATVGMTEKQAKRHYTNVDIYRSSFAALKQSFLPQEEKERSFLKLLVDRDSDRVIGMHLMAADAGEVIQGFAAAIKAGITKKQLDLTVGVHPTLAEEFVTMREASE